MGRGFPWYRIRIPAEGELRPRRANAPALVFGSVPRQTLFYCF